jgi:hypothetical protein
MKTRAVFPSNPLERDLSTPTKQIESEKGMRFNSLTQKKPQPRKPGLF